MGLELAPDAISFMCHEEFLFSVVGRSPDTDAQGPSSSPDKEAGTEVKVGSVKCRQPSSSG